MTAPPRASTFTRDLLNRPPTSGWDVVAKLGQFAIVSYAVPAERIRPHVHPRFDLDCFVHTDRGPMAVVSIVPFEDEDFRFVRLPWKQWHFGQTNYRTYVIDRETRQPAVWFFGTTLDSWSVAIPRHAWKLPWHRGRIRFDCAYDESAKRYTRYRMTTRSNWAPVDLELADTGEPAAAFNGIADFEAGLVALTHPLTGVYYRRDGALGSYRIWHDRLTCTAGQVMAARIDLFDRLGIVPFAEQANPHSVLLQRATEFTIYLPPERLV